MARAEGWDLREAFGIADEATSESLSFGGYLGDLILYLGGWGLGFLIFGSWQANEIGGAESGS